MKPNSCTRITVLLLVLAAMISIHLTAQDDHQAKTKEIHHSVVNLPNNRSAPAANAQFATADFLGDHSGINFSSAAVIASCMGLGTPCTSWTQCCSRLCSRSFHRCCALHAAQCNANDQCCGGACIQHRCN